MGEMEGETDGGNEREETRGRDECSASKRINDRGQSGTDDLDSKSLRPINDVVESLETP